jgi:hypothetical protein
MPITKEQLLIVFQTLQLFFIIHNFNVLKLICKYNLANFMGFNFPLQQNQQHAEMKWE